MRSHLPKLLVHAAVLLEEDAQATFDSCKGNSAPWVCADCQDKPFCSARRSHDERLRIAKALRMEASA